MEPEHTNNNKKKKDDTRDEDLSEEDLALKQQLELYVERAQDADPALQKVALESMRQEIRTSTSSMTSVPKPLKFLRPHYGTLKSFYESMPESDLKKLLADILSVLALTMSADGEPESLKYRMLGSKGDISSWGHEYVRNLVGEIAQDYAKRVNEEAKVDDLIELVEQVVAFHMKHNAEPEAVDLLMEVEDLDLLVKHVDKNHVKHILTSCSDLLGKKQLCYILARQGISFELDEEVCADDDDREALQEIINNTKLSEGHAHLTLARDIKVMEPKSPEDIYKNEGAT